MRGMKQRCTSRGAVALAAHLLVAFGGALGLGCNAAPGDADDAAAAEDAAAEDAAAVPATALALGRLGAGRTFTPYEPGEIVEIHHGIQGGWHVFIDGVLEGDPLDAECLVSLRILRADDGSDVATIQHLRAPDLRRDAEGRETLEELIVFIPDPDAVDGVEVIIEAELAFEDERLQGDEVLVQLQRADE